MVDVDVWRRRVFTKALTKANMRYITSHTLLHSYAALRLAADHNIADVSGQLGHHNVKMTLDVYNHWLSGQSKKEVDSLDTLHLSVPQTHPEAIN